MANPIQSIRDYQPSKSGLFWSCVVTGLAVTILGFTWGGWTTGGTANEMAEAAAEDAQAELAAAVCIERFMNSGDVRLQLASLKEQANSWSRENFIEDGGWAIIGEQEYQDAAELCAEHLVAMEVPTQETDAGVTGTAVQ